MRHPHDPAAPRPGAAAASGIAVPVPLAPPLGAGDGARPPVPPRRVIVRAIDGLVRRFGPATHLLAVLVLYAVAAMALGLAVAAGLWFDAGWNAFFARVPAPGSGLVRGIGFGLSFFVAGFALLVVVPLYNFVLPTRVRPYRGGYFTIASLPWCLHNFDPCLIHIGDDVVVGGAVHLFAHYGGAGHLTIAPVVIGDRATLGLGVTVMGDGEIGPDATILPHSVLLPGSRVGAGDTWAGVPARPPSDATLERYRRLREHRQAR